MTVFKTPGFQMKNKCHHQQVLSSAAQTLTTLWAFALPYMALYQIPPQYVYVAVAPSAYRIRIMSILINIQNMHSLQILQKIVLQHYLFIFSFCYAILHGIIHWHNMTFIWLPHNVLANSIEFLLHLKKMTNIYVKPS